MKLRRGWLRRLTEFSLPEYELNKLANYNAEKSRGLLHDPQWKVYMAELQERFDAASCSKAPDG